MSSPSTLGTFFSHKDLPPLIDFRNSNRKLLDQAEHADVIFEFLDGTNVRAHRAILSIRSPVVLTFLF
jgi:hypothetical protein